MTDELDKLAREIAANLESGQCIMMADAIRRGEKDDWDVVHAARIGIEAGEQRGMKLQRERDAAIADNRAKASKTAIDCMPNEDKSYLRGSLIASEQIAGAIRTQP